MTEENPPALPESVLLDQPRLPVEIVNTNESLSNFLTALSSSDDAIALDAERASGFRYGQRAFLLQVAIKDTAIFIIDPVADYDPEVWAKFIRQLGERPWIIHAASQDLPCLIELNLVASKIYDTELAARLLGLPRVALSTLTEHYLQIKLAKEHSAVDWSERPLPESWLVYAALDVDVLFDLWACIEKDLGQSGKKEYAEQEFEHLLGFTPKPPKQDRWRSMNGLHEIKDQRTLTIAKYLWSAREELAIEKDLAPGRLIPDSSVISALKENPKTRSELTSLRSFSGRASRTFIDIWWKAIEDGTNTKNLVDLRPQPSGIPNHRNWPLKFPLAHARLLAAREFLSQIAQEQSIPTENIVNPEVIRQLCFEPPEPIDEDTVTLFLREKQSRQWQLELIGQGLASALAAAEIKPEVSEPIPD
jgi:ribonuclease D